MTYTSTQAVSALWNAGLKARHDFSRANYETVLDAYLGKHPELAPHLRETVASILEEEEWMPPISLLRQRLLAFKGAADRAKMVDEPKPRTLEWDDDHQRTARARIPYRAQRDTEEYRSWMLGRLLGIQRGVLKPRTARELVRIADRRLLGKDLEDPPF